MDFEILPPATAVDDDGNDHVKQDMIKSSVVVGHRTSKGLMLAEGVGNAPTSAMPILFSRQVQPACICLPSVNGACGQIRTDTCDALEVVPLLVGLRGR